MLLLSISGLEPGCLQDKTEQWWLLRGQLIWIPLHRRSSLEQGESGGDASGSDFFICLFCVILRDRRERERHRHGELVLSFWLVKTRDSGRHCLCYKHSNPTWLRQRLLLWAFPQPALRKGLGADGMGCSKDLVVGVWGEEAVLRDYLKYMEGPDKRMEWGEMGGIKRKKEMWDIWVLGWHPWWWSLRGIAVTVGTWLKV